MSKLPKSLAFCLLASLAVSTASFAGTGEKPDAVCGSEADEKLKVLKELEKPKAGTKVKTAVTAGGSKEKIKTE